MVRLFFLNFTGLRKKSQCRCANVALDFVRGHMDNTHKNGNEKLLKVEKAR